MTEAPRPDRLGAWTLGAMPLVRAETLTGKLNGLRCAERGHLCPTRNLDAHLSLEQDFVLQEVNGEYWLLSNVRHWFSLVLN